MTSHRRWNRWLAPAFCVTVTAAFIAVSCTQQPAPPPAPAELTAAEKIARGKQVAYTSGCVDCHTPGSLYGAPDTTRMLSGSELGWEGPWGVTFPRNLTPDAETGIGSWSEQDIITAIREGRRPDGSPVLPPMPWPVLARMSDADVQALAAYLKSLPAVSHKAPDRVPPGTKTDKARLTIPPPPAWDAQHLPPPPAGAGK